MDGPGQPASLQINKRWEYSRPSFTQSYEPPDYLNSETVYFQLTHVTLTTNSDHPCAEFCTKCVEMAVLE